MNKKFHHIARALIFHEGKLLVAHYIGHHCFLPGGHIEFGESAVSALIREIKEELGIPITVKRYIGVFENVWEEKEKELIHHEISHLFEVFSEDLVSNITPQSKEPHLEFFWITPTKEELQLHIVMPDLLHELIPKVLKEKYKACWASNID